MSNLQLPCKTGAAWIFPLLQPTILFAQTAAASQETSVEYSAPWPPWVTILLVVGGAVFTYGLYYREQTEYRTWVKFLLATLRFALLCIVIWMMYGYTARPFRTDLPDLLLVMDTSQSMATVDAAIDEKKHETLKKELEALKLGTPTRLHQAKSLLLRNDEQLAKFLQKNYQTKLLTLSSAATEDTNARKSDSAQLVGAIRSLEADAESSQLGTTLRQALQRQRGRPVAAVVYITDGITTAGPPLSEIGLEAKQRGIPLHVVGLGSQLPSRDLRLSDLLVDDVVFVGDLVTFDLTLSGEGYKDQPIKVTLSQTADSASAIAEPVSKTITLKSDSDSQTVRLTFEAKEKGIFEFVIQTKLREGEASSDNNQLRAAVEVRDEETRVLLVQSYPSYEFHYLKTLLERGRKEAALDEGGSKTGSVKLSVLLQEADPEFADIDPTALRTFPTRDELFEYDVCIFGDVNPTFLGNDAMVDIRDFVRERGRGFVGIAGPRYFPSTYTDTPLAEIIPFDIRSSLTPPPDLPIETGFRPKVTPLGRRMPAMQLSLNPDTNNTIWSELPELYWLLEVDATKPGVRVLAEHPTQTNTSGMPLPVTTLSYVGAGKVLFQNTDDSWRWRIGHGDEYFGRYWQQSLRYLSRFKLGEGRDVELTSDREKYKRGEIVRLRARYFDERRAPDEDEGVVVMLEQAGRGQRRVSLKRDATDRGIFSADVANLTTGKYHGWISEPATDGEAPSADFEVTTPNTEMTRLQMDGDDLRKAANLSGGGFYTYESADSLIEDLPVGKQVRIEPLPPEPIWNSWKIALLFIALLVGEWLARRQVGMV